MTQHHLADRVKHFFLDFVSKQPYIWDHNATSTGRQFDVRENLPMKNATKKAAKKAAKKAPAKKKK